MLVDRLSRGDPERAGAAYAVNVVGCILGPLVSGFILLPLMNERWVTLLFALEWGPRATADEQYAGMLAGEVTPKSLEPRRHELRTCRTIVPLTNIMFYLRT
jgi:hypothetical protein